MNAIRIAIPGMDDRPVQAVGTGAVSSCVCWWLTVPERPWSGPYAADEITARSGS